MKEKEERSGAELVMPYGEGRDKHEEVEDMFDSIAPAYDFMNSAMTFGLHRYWRREALRALSMSLRHADKGNLRLLDIATGTGDVAFDLARKFPTAEVVGADLSEGMLSEARRKLEHQPYGIGRRVIFERADCLNLPYQSGSFDAATVAYGVRNFEHLEAGYREIYRVLKPGGVLCVIELSCPEKRATKALYDLYSKELIPAVGRLVSGDSRAYSYLPESIAAAPQRDAMTALMLSAGFSKASWRSLTFGAVTIYMGKK